LYLDFHEYRGWVGLMEQMAQIIACMKKEVVDAFLNKRKSIWKMK